MNLIETGSPPKIPMPLNSCLADAGLASSADTSLVCHCQICFKSNMQSSWSHLTQLFSPKNNSERFLYFLFWGGKGFASSVCFVLATIHGNFQEGKVVIKTRFRLLLAFRVLRWCSLAYTFCLFSLCHLYTCQFLQGNEWQGNIYR